MSEFFAVSFNDEGHGKIVNTLAEAESLMKTRKGARFKRCIDEDEAKRFLSRVVEESVDGAKKTESETSCPFPSLKPQECAKLKEAIGKGDSESVLKMVEANPRYLMTTCDAPNVVHSGTRANALHVATAKTGSLKMAKLVMDIVNSEDLVSRMYPDATAEELTRRREHLVDLYLNLPNKGHNDTPLHQAAKFGHVDIVRFLVGFSSCNPEVKNKAGLTPAQVACTRADGDDVDAKSAIIRALEHQVYIPVYRDQDSDAFFAGVIGEPCDKKALSLPNNVNLNLLASPRPKAPSSSSSPLLRVQTPTTSSSSPLLHVQGAFKTPSSPSQQLRVQSASKGPSSSTTPLHAILGPMSPAEADEARKSWKSRTPTSAKVKDPRKAIEKVGRCLASEFDGANFVEFWDFLDSYADFSNEDGLALLESHLSAVKKRLERERLEDVLDASIVNNNNANPTSPMSDLASALDALRISSPRKIDSQISNESFLTCNGDEDDEKSEASYATAEEAVTVYVLGDEPSAVDKQVFEAINGNGIDKEKFPLIHDWIDSVSAFDVDEMTAWKAPSKVVPKFDITL